MYEAKVEDRPKLRLAAVAHQGPYMQIGAKFGVLGKAISKAGLWPQVEAMIAVSYDDPEKVPQAQLRSHAGAILKPGAQVPDGLEEVELSGGRYATTTHQGPYHSLPEAYGYIATEWMQQNGESASDAACYEIYLNNPQEVPEEELLTAVYVPLR